MVFVGPPLFRSCPSIGFPRPPGQVVSPSPRLWRPLANSPLQLAPLLVEATIGFCTYILSAWSRTLDEEPAADALGTVDTRIHAGLRALTTQANEVMRNSRIPEDAGPVGDPDRAAIAAGTTSSRPSMAPVPPLPPRPATSLTSVLLVTRTAPPMLEIAPPQEPSPPRPPDTASAAPSTGAGRVADKGRATYRHGSEPISDAPADFATSTASAISRRSETAGVDTAGAAGAAGAGAVVREGRGDPSARRAEPPLL